MGRHDAFGRAGCARGKKNVRQVVIADICTRQLQGGRHLAPRIFERNRSIFNQGVKGVGSSAVNGQGGL